MLHLLSANYEWHHEITPTSEEIRVFATIFPMVRSHHHSPPMISDFQANTSQQDDLLLSFTKREPTAA